MTPMTDSPLIFFKESPGPQSYSMLRCPELGCAHDFLSIGWHHSCHSFPITIRSTPRSRAANLLTRAHPIDQIFSFKPPFTPHMKELLPMSTSLPSRDRIILTWPSWRTIVSSPVMYVMIVPLLAFDLCLEIFHRTVFPVLGIPLVARGDYIRLDRHRLSYLPWILKLACTYCGYANGLIHFASRITGDTEWYFCPSKHESCPGFHPAPHQRYFAEFGDRESFQEHFRDMKANPHHRLDDSLKSTRPD